MQTLRVHISTDLNRRLSARAMCVHANTVDYRLRRIGTLTGLNCTRATGVWRLRAALIARNSPPQSSMAQCSNHNALRAAMTLPSGVEAPQCPANADVEPAPRVQTKRSNYVERQFFLTTSSR
ncbi:helix-turn-helix domain-containing protein [Rhodococcus pyridinivorans]